MKAKSLFILLGAPLLTMPALAQHDPLLAAVVPSENAVHLYRVKGMQLQLQKSVPISVATKAETSNQMCLDPRGSTLFVSAPSENKVITIELNTQKMAGASFDETMKAADGCVISPDGKKLYVADRAGDAVFVFETGTRKLMKKIAVAKEPRRAIFLPNGKLIVSSGEG